MGREEAPRLHPARTRPAAAAAAGGLAEEAEERRKWRELEPEYDKLTTRIEAAEDRIQEILDTLRRDYVAVPIAPSPFKRPTIQEA